MSEAQGASHLSSAVNEPKQNAGHMASGAGSEKGEVFYTDAAGQLSISLSHNPTLALYRDKDAVRTCLARLRRQSRYQPGRLIFRMTVQLPK